MCCSMCAENSSATTYSSGDSRATPKVMTPRVKAADWATLMPLPTPAWRQRRVTPMLYSSKGVNRAVSSHGFRLYPVITQSGSCCMSSAALAQQHVGEALQQYGDDEEAVDHAAEGDRERPVVGWFRSPGAQQRDLTGSQGGERRDQGYRDADDPHCRHSQQVESEAGGPAVDLTQCEQHQARHGPGDKSTQ